MSRKRAIYDRVTRQIPAPQNQAEQRFKVVDTDDIIEVIMYANNLIDDSLKPAAQLLKGRNEVETMENVWDYVNRTIEYEKDPPGLEMIKAPAMTVELGKGDCKSFTILQAAMMKALGLNYKIRFAGYNGQPFVTHVYLVGVTSDGEEYIMDATHEEFDLEAPFTFTEDYNQEGNYAGNKRSGIGSFQINFDIKKVAGYALLFWAGSLLFQE